MHPRQINDRPLYTEILWEWRVFGRHIEPNLQRAIKNLQKKSDKPTKFQDQYLWIPNCEITLKLRVNELRIKQLLNCDSNDKTIQQWMTQVYHFPISINLFTHLVGKAPDLDELFTELGDQKMIGRNKFLSILRTLSMVSKQIKFLTITVKKDRELYLWHNNDHHRGDGVTIEIVKISKPEKLYSISLEDQNLNSIKSALSYLNISVDSYPEMKTQSYLEVLRYWFDGRKLY